MTENNKQAQAAKASEGVAVVTRRIKRIELNNQRNTSMMALAPAVMGMVAGENREARDTAVEEVKSYFMNLINAQITDFTMTHDNTSLLGINFDPISGVTTVNLITATADFNVRTGEMSAYKNPIEVKIKLG